MEAILTYYCTFILTSLKYQLYAKHKQKTRNMQSSGGNGQENLIITVQNVTLDECCNRKPVMEITTKNSMKTASHKIKYSIPLEYIICLDLRQFFFFFLTCFLFFFFNSGSLFLLSCF